MATPTVSERRTPHRAAADHAARPPDHRLGPPVGARLLSQLGFLHVPGRPFADGRSYLFVALRARPTRRHFDPERIVYWRSEAGRGQRAELDFLAPLEGDERHAWGAIRIVDRLGEANDYVTFGGQLQVERVGGARIVVLCSEAPIFARGGRSQGWEPCAAEAAGFLAVLRAAVGREREIERRVSALPATAIYSAFVASSLERLRRSGLAARHPDTLGILSREALRLPAEAPAEWAAGVALLRSLHA